MDHVTQFSLNTGAIECHISGPQNLLNEQLTKGNFIEGKWDAATYYVVDGEPTPRPENPTTLTDLTLNNVPIPAIITINSQTYATESDTIELEFDQPATYTVVVSAFPYLDKEFTIENQTP